MGGQGKSVLREASQKKVLFGTKSQMWVGAVGWSQTFINYCFMAHLTPFSSKIFGKFTIPNLFESQIYGVGGLGLCPK